MYKGIKMSSLKTFSLSLAVITALSFNGCGDSESNEGTDTDDSTAITKSGQFIDSPVSGIEYSTPTQSGLTSIDGNFTYREGETVTFKIGGINLGSTKANEMLTPQEVVGVTVVENSKAEDMLVLLQSLDSDHDSSNGIEINEATRNSSNSMNVNFIEDTIDINSIINQFGIDDSVKVSNTNAMAHFQETLKAKYPTQGLNFTDDIIKNKSFYKIFVKEDRTTIIYVKLTFNDNDVTFTFGTKDNFINGTTGSDTGTSSIQPDGTLKNGSDVWELLKIESDKIIILNTITTDDNGNTIPERKMVEKWLTNKPAGFP